MAEPVRERRSFRWWAFTIGIAVLGPAILVGVVGRVHDRIGYAVPANGGGSCRVWKNEPREIVRARCGPPCATGGVPKAACPDGTPSQGLISLCSWDCDIYAETAVCYAGGVIDVGEPGGLVRFSRCSWSAP